MIILNNEIEEQNHLHEKSYQNDQAAQNQKNKELNQKID